MPGPYVGNPFAGKFGYFQAAVNDPAVRATPGGVQMYVWQALQNDYLSRGESLPAGAFGAVNQLMSLAGQQRRAGEALSAGLRFVEDVGIDQSITGNMVAPHLDAGDLGRQVLGPQHRVVYMTQDLVEGEPVLSFKTHDFGHNLPQSISQLQADVEDAAQITAADYGFEWGGVATPVGIYSY